MQALKAISFLPLSICILLFSLPLKAQEVETTKAYISDNLFIYMHAGAGKNFRILGSVNAGNEIQLTGEKDNGYTQIITSKDRTGWIENKFVNKNESLRDVIAELNSQLALNAESEASNKSLLSESKNEIALLHTGNKQLESKIIALKEELALATGKIKTQDQEELQQWFFNGAIVLSIGLLIGIILPVLFRRKAKKSSWG